eukprot:m.190313 g.190313  ORF g.190313 m.190313 type:complete len:1050 (-) comp18020_c0_seq1:139-3288(-)
MEATLVELWEVRESVGGRWSDPTFSNPSQPSATNVRELHPDPGFTWHGRWLIDSTLQSVDEHGWQYLHKRVNSWGPKRKGGKKCRRRWVRLQVREVPAGTRPIGTGMYKFQLLTIYENQRLSEGRFSSRALKVADHPAFSDAVGGLSPERWMSSGRLGKTRYCAWRSTWQRQTDWEYAVSFKTPADEWTARQMEGSRVRRRQRTQVIQLEVVDPDKMAETAEAALAAASPAPAITPDAATEGTGGEGAASVPESPDRRSNAGTSQGGDNDTARSDGTTATTATPTVAPQDVKVPGPLEWVWTDCELPINVDTLNDVITQKNSRLVTELNAHRKVNNFEATDWVGQGVGRKREVRYVMPKTTMVKATPATEVQEYMVWAPGVAYAVDRLQSAPKLPYGTTFKSRIRDVITATSPTTTRMQSSIQLEWSSSPFAKSMILNGAKKGSKEAMTEIANFMKRWIAKNHREAPTEANTNTPLSPSLSGGEDASHTNSPTAPAAASDANGGTSTGVVSPTDGPHAAAASPDVSIVVSPSSPEERGRSNSSIGSRKSAASVRHPDDSGVEWVDGSNVDTCTVCFRTKFGLLSRQHHCRFCGRVVCSSCSQQRFWYEPSNRKERCCTECAEIETANGNTGASRTPVMRRHRAASDVSSIASMDVSGMSATTHNGFATPRRGLPPILPGGAEDKPGVAPAFMGPLAGTPRIGTPEPSNDDMMAVVAESESEAPMVDDGVVDVSNWKCPHNPMSLNELRKLHKLVDIYSVDNVDILRDVLRASTFEAADLIARVKDVKTSPVWDEWCHNPREKAFLVEEWEKAIVLAILIVDDASSRIEYHSAETAKERDEQRQVRADTESFIKSHKDVICRLATDYEIPEFLGVLSMLNEPDLAYKSMWRATIDRAIETANVHVIADNLQLFKADERVKTFANDFYQKNLDRLSKHLLDYRITELLDAMVAGDTNNAHAAIYCLCQDGFVDVPGGTRALLHRPDYKDDYMNTAERMARRFVEGAEVSALAAVKREQQRLALRRDRPRTPLSSRKSTSSLQSRNRLSPHG